MSLHLLPIFLPQIPYVNETPIVLYKRGSTSVDIETFTLIIWKLHAVNDGNLSPSTFDSEDVPAVPKNGAPGTR